MGIDPSIYSNILTPQVNLPSPLASAQQAMGLNQMAMQQQQMRYQLAMRNATLQAYQSNTDPETGQLNRQGFLSDLGRMNPMAAQQATLQFAQVDQAKAQAQAAQADAANKLETAIYPTMKYLAGIHNEDDRAQAYNTAMQNLAQAGVPMQNIPQANGQYIYDPKLFQAHWAAVQNSMNNLTAQKTQADIANTQAQTAKAWSETGNIPRQRLTTYQNMLQADDPYKKSIGVLTEGPNALAAINDALKNPGSAANVPIMLARLASGGQRLNEIEMEQQMKAGAYGDQFQQFFTKAKQGVMTPEMADYARQFATTLMGSAAQNKLGRENDIAGKYAVDAGLPFRQAYSQLTAQVPGTLAQTPGPSPRFAANSGAPGSQGSAALVPAASASEKPAPNAQDQAALQWLKSADPTSPIAFKVRAKLKSKGLL